MGRMSSLERDERNSCPAGLPVPAEKLPSAKSPAYRRRFYTQIFIENKKQFI
jgi:hypothetical protein